jgi:uncharacterized membrane protein YoaK (UPF0700 family)
MRASTGGARSYFAHPVHGPLPALLLLLTFGTGLIDAISILGLGRVFVANMTGNVVFIGFALAGAPGYSLWGSLVALVVSLVVGTPLGIAAQLAIVAIGALALGVQNAVVRQLGVPDMTTTVLTMTLTGIGSDLRKRDVATAGRRAVSVLAMLIGAVVGAILVLRLGVDAGLGGVTLVLAAALIGVAVAARGAPEWATRPASA